MNSKLTQINEGGLHSQNPLGGVPIGQNNSVEEGETIKNNFVYSNRIVLDANIVSQYNLPKSLIGKSVADATKMIDSKFKDRTDKISQSTKNSMLSKIAEAQEAMKPQEEPIMDSQMSEDMGVEQMYNGGMIDDGTQMGDTFVNTATSASDAFLPGSGQLLKAGDQFGQSVGNMVGGNKGESIGGLISPLGTLRGLGTAFKTKNVNDIPGVGIFGGETTKKKLEREAIQSSAVNANNKFRDSYAMGGNMNLIDPTKKLNSSLPIESSTNGDPFFNTKKIVKYQPGVTNDRMGSGFYLYSKDPSEAGFDYKRDREFVKQAEMMAVQRTPQWKEYMTVQSLKPKQLADGGYYDKNNPYFMTNPGPIANPANVNMGPVSNPDNSNEIFKIKQNLYPKSIQNLKADNTTVDSSILKQYNSEILNPNLFSTQKTLDGDRYSFKNQMKRVGETFNNNAGNIARYAPVAMNAYQLSQLKKPEGERLDRLTNRYTPEYVDEKSLQNIADNAMNNSVNAISQSGASQGQLRSSLIGSQLQRTKALSDAYMNASSQNRATNDRAQTFNLGVDQVNLNQSNTEKDINARDQAAYRNEKSKYLSEIGNNIGDVGKEEVYKNIIAKSTGYKWDGEYVKTPEGKVVTDPDTGKPMTEERLKEMQSTNNGKKALGGYLIKNRRK